MTTQKHTAIVRQWHIIQVLVASEYYISSLAVKEYLAGIGIHTDIRTIQRDLQSLSELFPIECNKDDKPYSWRWKQIVHTKNKLTLKQAFVFALIDKELQGVIPDEVFCAIEPLIARSRYMLAGIDDELWNFEILGTRPTLPNPTNDNEQHLMKHGFGGHDFGRGYGHGMTRSGRGLFESFWGSVAKKLGEKPHVKKEHIRKLSDELDRMGLDGFAEEIKSLAKKDFYY
ncbi:Uncharacterised protein [Moraxella lacunata]|uniref:WYL domain-containing protein n=1 Tax=Moraxella lacunata TaxID=477 RepID=A0A378QH91_MORLA|nr:hypothetical protein [Moraxella lacunata]STZ00021.1 Uncharacterised protein [Moraxella lacunata]